MSRDDSRIGLTYMCNKLRKILISLGSSGDEAVLLLLGLASSASTASATTTASTTNRHLVRHLLLAAPLGEMLHGQSYANWG